MDPSTYRGLTFLLSLGALPIACNPEKNDTTDGGTGGGTTGTTNGATTGATTGAASVTDGGSGSGSATDSGGTTSGTSGPTSGTSGETETGGPNGACASYVAYQVKCDPGLAGMEAQLLADCEAGRMMNAKTLGDACLALYDVYFECLGNTAMCDNPTACEAEGMAAFDCLPEPGAGCKAYATKYVECVPDTDPGYIGGLCQGNINYGTSVYGAGCGAAYEDFFACLGGLSCNDFMMAIGCEAQQMAVDAACM